MNFAFTEEQEALRKMLYNQRARPFVWTKSADDILAKTKKPQDTSGTEH